MAVLLCDHLFAQNVVHSALYRYDCVRFVKTTRRLPPRWHFITHIQGKWTSINVFWGYDCIIQSFSTHNYAFICVIMSFISAGGDLTPNGIELVGDDLTCVEFARRRLRGRRFDPDSYFHSENYASHTKNWPGFHVILDLLACGFISSCSGLELQDPVPISNDIKTSYLKISQILETARFVFRIVRLLWNLTVMHISSSAADVPVKFQSNTIIYTINLAYSSVWIPVVMCKI